MGLEKYISKRDFSKTSEPKTGKSKNGDKLHFVVQKHDASHLHYDFRLEMLGVLKSWAVPKGPSTNPKDKRLAMMVEDHPFDYKDFEGIIPKEEYGGGTVMIWDAGTYEPIEIFSGIKEQEKHLIDQLHNGSLKIKLNGKKLHGEFALVKTNGMGENSWLLIKHNDKYASATDVTKKDKSVRSGQTIESIEKTSKKAWIKGHEEKVKLEKKNPSKKAVAKVSIESILKKCAKSIIPKKLKPMLTTLVNEPFDDPNWQYEVKWDGYRVLASLNCGEVNLSSRNQQSFNEKFYPIYNLLKEWRINAVFDGEILVINNKGISDFSALQNWISETDGYLIFYVFDLLWYEGKNLMDLPLYERQSILHEILPINDDRVRLGKVFKARGIDFFDAAKRMGLEGIIAKRSDSIYSLGIRSKDWLKIKIQNRQEVIIAGFTINEDTPKSFSSLLLGVYKKDKLQYVGKVGTGFSNQLQMTMMEKFGPLIIDKSAFEDVSGINKTSRFRSNAHKIKTFWLSPKLVCEISFTEVTEDGLFRHPSFKGMRTDKKAKEVIKEIKKSATEVLSVKEVKSDMDTIHSQDNELNKMFLNAKTETEVKKVKGQELKFTHLNKLYWPEDKVTKRDLFNYYHNVAEYILPYLKDRPQSLNRFPGGIHGQSFYQKDVKGKAPDWIKTFPYSTTDGEHKEYLVGADEATLMWMISLGCIEMNPWFSRIQSPEHPDYCVIDLDPDKNTFDQVIMAAQETKKILDVIEVPCFCKTSGSTGMHIYIPLNAKYTYDQSQMFAKIIVGLVHQQVPEYTSLERIVSDRKGKMYLDFLQNRSGATIASPYSLRPKIGATVSMPLHWDEVKPGLKMRDFNIFNAISRLKIEGDLFKGVLGKGIDLKKAIKKAKTVFG